MFVLWIALCLGQVGDAPQGRRPATPPARTAPADPKAASEDVSLSDPAVLAVLASELEADDANVRENAFERLSRAPKALVAPLIKVALDSEQEATRLLAIKLVRRHVAKTLGRDVARVLARDRSEIVRREASHAVLEVAPKDAARILREAMLEDESLMVRRAAINDLGRLRTLEAAEALVEGYEWIAEEPDPDYLIGHVANALTLATGKSFGRNLEAWQFCVADLRRLAEEADAVAGGELAGVEPGEDEESAERDEDAEEAGDPPAPKKPSPAPRRGG